MPDTSERSPRIAALPLIEPDHTLAWRGASALREMILTGVLEMGSRLNEVDLSEAFGIGRPPLREAIRSLASQGLLEIVNHKGALPGRANEALDEHRNILKILTLRDGDAAAELMTQRLRRSLANAMRVSVIEGAPNSGATPVRDGERPGRATT